MVPTWKVLSTRLDNSNRSGWDSSPNSFWDMPLLDWETTALLFSFVLTAQLVALNANRLFNVTSAVLRPASTMVVATSVVGVDRSS